MHITQMLYVRAEQSLDIFLRIFAYLLEFIESDNTRFVGLFKALEYLRQRIFRTGYVPESKAEDRQTACRVKPELRVDGFQALHKTLQHFRLVERRRVNTV